MLTAKPADRVLITVWCRWPLRSEENVWALISQSEKRKRRSYCTSSWFYYCAFGGLGVCSLRPSIQLTHWFLIKLYSISPRLCGWWRRVGVVATGSAAATATAAWLTDGLIKVNYLTSPINHPRQPEIHRFTHCTHISDLVSRQKKNIYSTNGRCENRGQWLLHYAALCQSRFDIN